MKIVVDIPDEEYERYALAITFGMGNTAIKRILNGTPLPEGEIVDIRPLMRGLYEEMCMGEVTYTTSEVYKMLEEECQVIIGADKEYGVKAITRGNCMACGKELTEGAFFCKECEEKGRKEGSEE